MTDLITVKANGLATIFFEPKHKELLHMGLETPFELAEELEESLEINFPGLMDFVDFESNTRFININCDTEEIAEVVNQELVNLIEYRVFMMDEEANFTEDQSQLEIKKKIREIEEKLAELKKLLA